MTTLTDKELIKEIKERIGSLDVRDNIELRAYEIALASLEAEPVGEFYEYKPGDWYQRSVGDKAPKWVPLYATPPVPELQADVAQAIENLKQKLVECNRYNYCADAVKGVEDACRAAMLHSAEPASNHEELPLDYLQGQKDGLEWAAQLAEANHPQTGDWLYDDPLELAKAIRKGPDMPEFDGPTPVTPDGWISCSERMPEDTKMLLAFSQGEIVAAYWNWVVNPIDYKKYRAFTYLSGNILDDVTHWMPLPEPPL
ncbi:DUF551 domain-containing protein [Escherichia coli]|nr:DUF551 domain-containing protein [Escherichia coli]MDT4766977.1 DUF551 domain-containing protein [Escherichia coli]HAK9789641.1 DUF551 domain-containing protein [Escherichia coli]HBA4783342.1 DUF551 domain-containing protein [Escherichia coli]HBB8517028.1 DUF551 domain-containing protein [Escherichia coli]HCO3488208.1 DUF551 domain-containing protein [Escherichia coli]